MVSRSALWVSTIATLLVAIVAAVAHAEEAVVLDNGAVLRGTVIREDEREVVFKLAGIGRDGRVTIEKSRISQRFVTQDSRSPIVVAQTPSGEPSGPQGNAAPVLASYLPSSQARGPTVLAPMLARTTALPEEEPTATDEDFFRRSARRALLAFPKSSGPRAALVVLAIALLLALVEIGGRIVEADGLSLGKSTTLALLLGLLVSIDVIAADTLLRADRAPVLILAELLAWVGCAAGILRCGIASAFQLLAFVLVAGALVALVTGGVLVSI